jgi:hypothetical protein
MTHLFKSMTVITSVTMLSVAYASASDCGFLKRDPLGLRDAELFFNLPGSDNWQSLDETSVALGGQKISFAYVIQEKFDQRRSGVVIVKSGRKRVAGEPVPEAPKLVELVREKPDKNSDNSEFGNGRCGLISDFVAHKISATSYDQYHDLGRKVADQDVLNRFHYKYVGRGDRCRRTDNSDPDSRVPRDDRSNRGQFSFNPDIVRLGTDSQVASLLSPNVAYAGTSDGLAEQRVEMKAYRAQAGLPTCVLFKFTVPASTGFVRINDLEGLTQHNLDFLRSDEKAWTLSR